MATPTKASTSVQTTLPAQEVTPPSSVPAGVGAAPTRIESAAQKPEPGYFERGVVWLKNLILSFLRKICPFLNSAQPEAPPSRPQAPPPAPVDPRISQAKVLLEQLRIGVMPFNLLAQFDTLIPENGRKEIYRSLGESVPFATSENWSNWTQSAIDCRNVDKGQAMVRHNPILLAPYLITRLQQIVS